MLDRTVAQRPDRSPVATPGRMGRERRRALAACAVLAIALHAAFVSGVGGLSPGAATETVLAPMSVRTLPGEPEAEPAEEVPVAGGGAAAGSATDPTTCAASAARTHGDGKPSDDDRCRASQH